MSITPREAQTTAALPDPMVGDLIGSGVEGGVVDQVRAYFQRLRGGEMGALPAIGGLVVLVLLFSALSPYFFTERNFANLLTQAAELVMLGMALVFVLLLGEIDLSAGVTGGVAMCAYIVLVDLVKWPTIPALLIAFAIGLATGAFIGFFVAKVGIPSFVVTLGLFLGLQGIELIIIGNGGLYNVQDPVILAIMNNNLPIWGGWAMLAIMVLISIGTSFWDRARRTRAGVPNRSILLVWGKVVVIAVVGGVIVALLSQNRATGIIPIEGVPIVVPLTLAILWVGTFVLDRTKYGRYLYAVGGNAEAARRSGVNVVMIRWVAFVICSVLAVLSQLLDISRIGSVNPATGVSIVLSGVAAAVVGGVSLFGGRGRLMHAAIGAVVIAVITNGLGLLNLPGGVNLAVTGGVLILAATVDAVSRRTQRGSSDAVAATAQRPVVVTVAWIIWLVGAILTLIDALFAFAVSALALTTPGDHSIGVLIIVVAFVLVAVGVVEILLANRMHRGQGWARIALTVLGVIGIVGSIAGAFDGGFNTSSVWAILGVVAVVVAIVFMYLPGASEFFRTQGGAGAGAGVPNVDDQAEAQAEAAKEDATPPTV